MKRFNNLYFSALLFSLAVGGASCSPDPIEMSASIEGRIDRVEDYLYRFTQTKTPGIQYVALERGEAIIDYAGGWSDIINSKEMTSSVTMNGYSMTKVITAIAVLQLVEAGKVELSTSVSDFVPESPFGQDVTISQLLSHTGGLPAPTPTRWVHLANEHEGFDEAAALTEVLEESGRLKAYPGEEYRYSNLGYWLLGKLIEKVSGKSYVEYVRQNILKPLQIKPADLDFVIHDFENHATGYLSSLSMINWIKSLLIDEGFWGESENGWVRIHPHYLNGPAFGGLIGNARGFAAILNDLLKEEPILLKSETLRLMLTQQTLSSGKAVPMTNGWHTGILKGVPFAYKEGGGMGYHSELRIYPTLGLATVLMVNKTMLDTKQTLNTIDAELLVTP